MTDGGLARLRTMEITFEQFVGSQDPLSDDMRDAWRDAYRDLAPALIGYLRAQHVEGAEDAAVQVLGVAAKRIVRLDLDDHALAPWAFVFAHHAIMRSRRGHESPE